MRRSAVLALLTLPLLATDFRAGRGAVKITPPKGAPMAGYYYVRLNEGVHDDLWSKAIVLESGGRKAALVALDLVSIPRPFVEQAREMIGKQTGIPGAAVMISATHSHTGPEMGGRLKGVDAATERLAKDYHASLPGLIAESVKLADADLRPARIKAAAGREESISFIRRFFMTDGSTGWNPGKLNPRIVRPAGEIDPSVPLVVFETGQPEPKPAAAYVNFANHLDTAGGMQYSADYPYTLARLLSEAKGAEMMTLFTIGCAGNINHIDVKSSEPQKGHGEAARIGTILAAAVLKAWTQAVPVEPGELQTRSEILRLEPAKYPPADVEKAREVVAAYGKPNARPFYEQVHAFKVLELEERRGRPLEAEVQVITLGRDIAWVGLPGEIFVELGRAIKNASPFRYTIVAELANGSVGYVPDRRAYPQGAYEVISSRLAEGGGEAMAEAAVRLLLAK